MTRGSMEYRTLGRTGLRVSAVGFGTCQLRRVTPMQAIDTLLHGFELGVNLVHTAPDYEGAEDLVAAAVARSSRQVIVASQAYDYYYNSTGRVHRFEKLFEATCRKLKTDRLDLFGIACIDDREAFGENVWGAGGMIDFLHRMKAKGRLGGIFCTTHGSPEYICRLLERDALDAIMVAYNDLGFHLLSINPGASREPEDLVRTAAEVFPLAASRNIGVMVMKPFGGGLLCPSKAFPPGDIGAAAAPAVEAKDVLRSILSRPEVTCVVPGTASVAEAEENARAGYVPVQLSGSSRAALGARVDALRASLCSRCGLCEPTCSQHLPISMLFRAAYVALHPAEAFETWEQVEYFNLQPRRESACATCSEVTCACPFGINVPTTLCSLNDRMLELERRGAVAPPRADREAGPLKWFAARVHTRDVPSRLAAGRPFRVQLFVENAGLRPWEPPETHPRSGVRMIGEMDGVYFGSADLRHRAIVGHRCHFVLDAPPVGDRARVRLTLRLVRGGSGAGGAGQLVLFDQEIPVREEHDNNYAARRSR